MPKTAAAREALAATIGADGRQLLQAVEAATDLPWLREVPAVQTLRQVWAEPYTDPPGPLRWRPVQDRAPSAELIASPYDPAARYVGLAKTHLQYVITAVALNVVRLGAWWLGTPPANTRCSPFVTLRGAVA